MKKTLTKRFAMRFLLLFLVLVTLYSALSAGQPVFSDAKNRSYTIKNIIVMIPDGGGFGNFDMAEAFKLSGNKLPGLTTPVTTDTISGMTCEGLYLSNFLVGTSITHSANSDVTDSAAGGTAIATGYKTKNDWISVTPEGAPVASLLEASQLAGKSTGIVATKFWFDATPASFVAHSISRSNYDQITAQMLNHKLDVLLGGGNGSSTDGKFSPQMLGYTVVENKTQLEKAVKNGATKVWSSFNSGNTSSLVRDYQNSTRPAHPTILDMTKAAISILSENIDNPNGFFLMIEGSQVDTGGHSSDATYVVSEYLAFDEAFAYVVEWAKKDGETLVVGVPDHDTGGFTPEDETAAIEDVSNAKTPISFWDGNGNHTGQNVPIWAYGPEDAVEDLLDAMGLPKDNNALKARTGRYYRGVEFNSAYSVQNTALAHGVANLAGLNLDEATKELFVDITSKGKYRNGVFTVKETGIQIPVNENYYLLEDGTRADFRYGISVYSGFKFYVPKHVAEADGTIPLDMWVNPFEDVSESDAFYNAVAFVNSNRLFLGTDKGFEPHIPMTRAMYVTVLGRLAKADVSDYSTPAFKDVAGNMWYSEYVGWANANNVVSGDGYGSFMPDNNITREQMMIIVYNYAKYIGKETSGTTEPGFADANEIHDWARDAVVYCTAYGLVSADENNKIRPTENATRAEVAELMMNFATKVVNS